MRFTFGTMTEPMTHQCQIAYTGTTASPDSGLLLYEETALPGVQTATMCGFFCCCFLNFCRTHVNLWGHWYPVLDFWWRLLWVSKPEWILPYLHLAESYMIYTFPQIHLWYDTLPAYNASKAASCLPYMHISAEVGCRDLNCQPPAWQSDTLPTRPRWPARNNVRFIWFD